MQEVRRQFETNHDVLAAARDIPKHSELNAKTLRINTPLGSFDVVPFNGVNESGYAPIGDYVLVLPDQASGMTAGGIELPEDMRERISAASETGILVALGDNAFLWNADRSRKYEGPKPEIGKRIFFERYAGMLVPGDDGKTYRVFSDKCIALRKTGIGGE